MRCGLTMHRSPRRAGVVRLRPGLVISADFMNQHSPVVLVAAITSKKTEKVYPFEAVIDASKAGLPQRSKVLLMHLRSLDKRSIVGHYGSVDGPTLERVDAALRIAAGLLGIIRKRSFLDTGPGEATSSRRRRNHHHHDHRVGNRFHALTFNDKISAWSNRLCPRRCCATGCVGTPDVTDSSRFA